MLNASFQSSTLFARQVRHVAAGAEHGIEGVAVFRGLALISSADSTVTGDRAQFGAGFFSAGFSSRHAGVTLDQALDLVEVGHDGVVTLVQFSGPAFVGVGLDFFEGLAGLVDQTATLFVQVGDRHFNLHSGRV